MHNSFSRLETVHICQSPETNVFRATDASSAERKSTSRRVSSGAAKGMGVSVVPSATARRARRSGRWPRVLIAGRRSIAHRPTFERDGERALLNAGTRSSESRGIGFTATAVGCPSRRPIRIGNTVPLRVAHHQRHRHTESCTCVRVAACSLSSRQGTLADIAAGAVSRVKRRRT